MDRPALKQLLADIESGKVNCIVVYKVDRLTRSIQRWITIPAQPRFYVDEAEYERYSRISPV